MMSSSTSIPSPAIEGGSLRLSLKQPAASNPSSNNIHPCYQKSAVSINNNNTNKNDKNDNVFDTAVVLPSNNCVSTSSSPAVKDPSRCVSTSLSPVKGKRSSSPLDEENDIDINGGLPHSPRKVRASYARFPLSPHPKGEGNDSSSNGWNSNGCLQQSVLSPTKLQGGEYVGSSSDDNIISLGRGRRRREGGKRKRSDDREDVSPRSCGRNGAIVPSSKIQGHPKRKCEFLSNKSYKS